jgi:hypothetical protein
MSAWLRRDASSSRPAAVAKSAACNSRSLRNAGVGTARQQQVGGVDGAVAGRHHQGVVPFGERASMAAPRVSSSSITGTDGPAAA